MSEIARYTPNLGLQLLAELEKSGAVTETSLTLPPDLPFDQYEALATMFGQLHRTSAWLIGDLLNYGEKVYGETYTQASAATGLAEQTLMNYASVCGRVPRSRRKKKLPFSVHAEIASMSPADQEKWLRLAAQGGWTRSQLRDELAPLRALAPIQSAPIPTPAVPIYDVVLAEDGYHVVIPEETGGLGVNEIVVSGPFESKKGAETAKRELIKELPPAVSHVCQCADCGRVWT